MPFTELALPNLKAGPEVQAAFAAVWPASAKILASQPDIIRAFHGSVIRENDISTKEENKPILIIGEGMSLQIHESMLTQAIEWTEEAAFNAFLTSEDFAAFSRPMKPLAAGPPELQIFGTNEGPLEAVSAPLIEILRVHLKDNAESAAATKDGWTAFVKAVGKSLPVISGMSLNLKNRVFMGMIGWESLEVCKPGWT